MKTATNLRADAGAPRRARALLRDLAADAGCTGERTEQAALLVSELVTNAVLHGGSDEIGLALDLDGATVEVAVQDGSSAEPVVLPVDPARLDGRGLHLVDHLADAWGVDRLPDGSGKAVWFRVPCR